MNSQVDFEPTKKKFSFEELEKLFDEIFLKIDHSKNRFEVFKDFVTCSACALRNSLSGISKNLVVQSLEDEYHKIMAKYSNEDKSNIHHLFGLLVAMMEARVLPHDVLGDLYMRFEFGSSRNGQHFTPTPISNLLAVMNSVQIPELIKQNGYASCVDPACGAGSTLLATVKCVIDGGFNPAKHLYMEGTDIDRLVALMCYVQLSLWNVPGRVFVGDSLTLKMREVWITPAYVHGAWYRKLNH